MQILTERTDAVEVCFRHLQTIAEVRGDRRLSYVLKKKKSSRAVILTALSQLKPRPPWKNPNDVDEFVENVAYETIAAIRGNDLEFGVYFDDAAVGKEQMIWEFTFWNMATAIANLYLDSVNKLRRTRERVFDDDQNNRSKIPNAVIRKRRKRR